jgi:hypothetical protein
MPTASSLEFILHMNSRPLVWMVAMGLLLIALAAVAFKPPHSPARPAPFGVTSTTVSGLRLRAAQCRQDGGDVVASGDVLVEGDPQSPSITVTLNALRMDGTFASRTATYPSPVETGSTLLPFRLNATTGMNIAYVCDIDVQWGAQTS